MVGTTEINQGMNLDHMENLYTSRNPLVRYVHLGRLKKIVSLIPRKSGLKIIDAGCGEGQLLFKISESLNGLKPILYGTDITEVPLESAKMKVKGAILSLQDLRFLNYKNESFDVIVCSEVIEHIPEYKKVLGEFKRILKKGGLLIISFPNEPLWTLSRFFLGRKPIKIPGHCNSFSPGEIIKEVNLKVKKRVNIPFSLPHFVALTRILVFEK